MALCLWIFVVTLVVRPLNTASQTMSPESTSTYVDSLISQFFNAEREIWTKIDKRSRDVDIDIKEIQTERSYYFERDHTRRLVSFISSAMLYKIYAEPYKRVRHLIGEINHFGTSKIPRDQTNLTVSEIDARSLEILGLANELFVVTSRDSFWKYGLEVEGEDEFRLFRKIAPPHQMLYMFYEYIQFGFLKSYMLLQKLNMIGCYNKYDKYCEQARSLAVDYSFKFAQIRQIAKQYILRAQKSFYPFQSNMYYTGQAYEQITNFLQGYIENEVNLNEDGSCSDTCGAYQKTKLFHCQANTACDQQSVSLQGVCSGNIQFCREFDDVNVCQSQVPYKLYSGAIYNDGRSAGVTKDCLKSKWLGSTSKWFTKCSNCFCLCDDPLNSDRYFSLREVVSNIEANKIVTGVQLVKRNRMIQLNIQERKLLSFGRTTDLSNGLFSRWSFKGSEFAISESVVEGVDYYTLTYENRSINLDTVTVPNGYVVTGVRFAIVNGHIALEVRGTQFDFVTGKLNTEANSVWTSSPKAAQYEIVLGDAAPPLEEYVETKIEDRPNTFVKFGPTDYWSDMSQSTVPFFDASQVEPDIPVALSGVGLYFKGGQGYGGFISMKIVIQDFGQHIPLI